MKKTIAVAWVPEATLFTGMGGLRRSYPVDSLEEILTLRGL